MNSITDNDTVSTAELLDLIEADVSEAAKISGGSLGSSRGSNGQPRSGGLTSTPRKLRTTNKAAMKELSNTDPFSVRLTPQSSTRRRPSSSAADSDADSSYASSEGGDSVSDMTGFNQYKKYSTAHSHSTNSGGKVNHRSSSGRSRRRSSNNGKKRTVIVDKRQRMPLGGGYGGMFESHNTHNDDDQSNNGSMNDFDSQGTSKSSKGGGEGDDISISSSISGSVFSFASKLFFGKKKHGGGGGSWNPYTGSSGVSIQSRLSMTPSYIRDNSILITVSRYYLALPFRLRYFVQLFSIIGVLMIASLNYFIAMDYQKQVIRGGGGRSNNYQQQSQPQNNFGMQQQHQSIMEGGGASPNHHIPRLRVRDPLKFLHHDLHPNELLERATAKFRGSTRYGNENSDIESASKSDGRPGSGDLGGPDPFVYGWKSMPRQIFNDFATGLSDDTKTIEHEKNVDYFQMKAQKKVGFSDHEDNVDVMPGTGGKRPIAKGTVAYVLPITDCYPSDREQSAIHQNIYPESTNVPDSEDAFRDFALMLRAMVHGHSYSNPASGSLYDYKMHAIIHPRAKKCIHNLEDGVVDRSIVLQNLGYHVEVKSSPVPKSSIQGSEYLKEYMTGVVGGDEIVDLIRLYAYELEEYDVVVLVDYDTLILGPIDKAVDLIVSNPSVDEEGGSGSDGDKGGDNGEDSGGSIDAVFSWEHLQSLSNPQARASVVNLSFFLLRPSKETFSTLISKYQNSPFSATRGWGTLGRGSFPGWMTTQGFLTYYYDEVANFQKVEMYRCAFGNSGQDYNMDNSILITNGGKVECGNSFNGGVNDKAAAAADFEQCNECSKSKPKDVYVADFSYCRAPWECGGSEGGAEAPDTLSSGLCRQFQNSWFSARLQMEDVHPQLQKGNGQLCANGQYQPMALVKSDVQNKPREFG